MPKKVFLSFLAFCIMFSMFSSVILAEEVDVEAPQIMLEEPVDSEQELEVTKEEMPLEEVSYPEIWITEVVPNPAPDYRKTGGNYYEYMEVFNNSDEVLNLKDYTLWYLYPDTTKPKSWKITEETAIQPYSTGIVWFAKESIAAGYTSVNDLNTHYNSTLLEDEVIIFDNKESAHFNLPNELNRGLALAAPDTPNEHIVEAWYDASASGAHSIIKSVRNASVYYAPAADSNVMVSLGTHNYGNPGVLEQDQIPASITLDVVAPILTHTQTETKVEASSIYNVTVTSNEELSEATLWYWNTASDDIVAGQVEVMQDVTAEGFVYRAELQIATAGTYRYIIEGIDLEGNTTRLPINSRGYSLTVSAQSGGEGTDPEAPSTNGVPRILITELVPHPLQDYRTGGGNQYEFLELYNNSDEVLNLKDYTLWYLYPTNTAPKKWVIPYETAIEPYTAAVVWFAKEAVTAGYTTTEDFNMHYHTSLNDSDIIFYDNKNSADFNLPNVTNRGIGISSKNNANELIVEAWYDSNTNGADKLAGEVRNTAIRFTYPSEGIKMTSLGTRTYSTPGSIDAGQVPAVEGVDMVAPTIEHTQAAYNIMKNDPFVVSVTSDEALNVEQSYITITSLTDSSFNQQVSLVVAAQSNGQFSYEGMITLSELGNYRYTLTAYDLAGHSTKIPYNSLGALLTVNETAHEVNLPDVGLSIEDGAFVSDELAFYAYGDKASSQMSVLFNNQTLVTKPALPGSVQFGLQSTGVDQIYQTSMSAVDAQGNTVYFARLLPKYVDGAWTIEELPASYFVDSNIVSVHAGNENAPYDLASHDKVYGINNHDDYSIQNLHLVLPDGTLVKPTHMTNYAGAKTVTDAPYVENMFFAMGDGNAQKALISTFHFPIPEEKYTARYVYIDTKLYEDGQYNVQYVLNNNEVSNLTITVDNTAPVIEAVMLNNETELLQDMNVKGNIVLDVKASDSGSDIASITAKLDGEAIALPYQSSSVQMSAGDHVLEISVFDGAGNESSTSYAFHVADERPLEPSEVSPADFEQGVSLNATLSAKFEDATGDRMNVEFFKGHLYDVNNANEVKGFSNVADREPPLTIESTNEQALTTSDIEKISAEDGDYLYNDSTSGFPYHRFEVEVGTVDPNAVVELYWKGRTLPNRIVTLYAWDYTTEKWTSLTAQTGVSAEEDITLLAEVDAEKYVRSGKIQAMIQDEVKGVNDPFSMLWFTDTQYYAESYNDIFDTLGDWIVDQYQAGEFSYAIHTGDIVNRANVISQWEVADRNLKKLDDANVPYGVLAGNHDVIIEGVDYSYYHQYVGADRYENNPWYGGQMNNNQNHYDLISIGGHDFIVLYIGFGLETTPETISWANEALKKHADRNAIVGLHAYLESNGTLSNMAQQVYDEVIAPNKNVMMVLSGHYHAAKTVIKTVEHEDGTSRQLIEMLADYQGGPNGGDGYVRLLNFDPEAGMLEVQTYSPVLDDYNFFEEENVDSFTQPIQLMDINKRVATDYFAVNVYEGVSLGKVEDVASGTKASVKWNNLKANTNYFWYMVIEDEFGAVRRSEIHRFTTKSAGNVVNPTPTPETPVTPTPSPSPTPDPDQPAVVPDGYKEVDSTIVNGLPTWSVAANEAGNVYTSFPYNGNNALQLVVWLVDEEGNRTLVPSGRYDASAQGIIIPAAQAGQYVVTLENVSFQDVASSAWYSDAIKYMGARGIVQGTGNGLFNPSTDVKRADFLIMLMNTLGFVVNEQADQNFADAGNKYYSQYLATAKQLGIVQGSGNNLFKPEDSITRQDMMVMLYRALQASGITLTSISGNSMTNYSDVSAIPAYALEAVTALVEAGIIQGNNGLLEGQESTTRAMTIQMLYQYVLMQ